MANSMKHLPLPLTCPLHLLRLLLLLLLVLVLMLDSCRLVMVQGHGLGREIVVGEDQHWRFGLNYSAWADKTGPFFVGDTLVFYYEPSVFNGIPVNHNVYLLHDTKQFRSCHFGAKALLLAGTSQGKQGFKFTLTKRKKTYYFACGIADGLHCDQGLMKFRVKTI